MLRAKWVTAVILLVLGGMSSGQSAETSERPVVEIYKLDWVPFIINEGPYEGTGTMDYITRYYAEALETKGIRVVVKNSSMARYMKDMINVKPGQNRCQISTNVYFTEYLYDNIKELGLKLSATPAYDGFRLRTDNPITIRKADKPLFDKFVDTDTNELDVEKMIASNVFYSRLNNLSPTIYRSWDQLNAYRELSDKIKVITTKNYHIQMLTLLAKKREMDYFMGIFFPYVYVMAGLDSNDFHVYYPANSRLSRDDIYDHKHWDAHATVCISNPLIDDVIIPTFNDVIVNRVRNSFESQVEILRWYERRDIEWYRDNMDVVRAGHLDFVKKFIDSRP